MSWLILSSSLLYSPHFPPCAGYSTFIPKQPDGKAEDDILRQILSGEVVK